LGINFLHGTVHFSLAIFLSALCDESIFFKYDPIAASYMINAPKMKILTVKQILDHSDIKITERHYVRLNLKGIREELDEFKLDDFVDNMNSY